MSVVMSNTDTVVRRELAHRLEWLGGRKAQLTKAERAARIKQGRAARRHERQVSLQAVAAELSTVAALATELAIMAVVAATPTTSAEAVRVRPLIGLKPGPVAALEIAAVSADASGVYTADPRAAEHLQIACDAAAMAEEREVAAAKPDEDDFDWDEEPQGSYRNAEGQLREPWVRQDLLTDLRSNGCRTHVRISNHNTTYRV